MLARWRARGDLHAGCARSRRLGAGWQWLVAGSSRTGRAVSNAGDKPLRAASAVQAVCRARPVVRGMARTTARPIARPITRGATPRIACPVACPAIQGAVRPVARQRAVRAARGAARTIARPMTRRTAQPMARTAARRAIRGTIRGTTRGTPWGRCRSPAYRIEDCRLRSDSVPSDLYHTAKLPPGVRPPATPFGAGAPALRHRPSSGGRSLTCQAECSTIYVLKA
jgi:hypothetical protein